jgi:hypothetical protein
MVMKVVHIKKANYSIYIGRAGNGENGFWGNPIKVNAVCSKCKQLHETRGSTLACYETYLRTKLETSSVFKLRFMALDADDVLGCFCSPEPCHGDIMIKVWQELQNEA